MSIQSTDTSRGSSTYAVPRAFAYLALLVMASLLPATAKAQSGIFRSSLSTSSAGTPLAFGADDIDQSGGVDAVVAVADATANVFLNPDNDGDLIRCVGSVPLSGTPSALLLGQFDTDGVVDLVVADTSNHRLQSFLGQRTGVGCNNISFVPVPGAQIATKLNPISVVSDFFDEDDHLDLVVANRGPEGDVGALVVLRGGGDGNFTPVLQPVNGGPPQDSLATANDTHDVASADVDGDGILDLLAVNAGADSLLTFLGNGDATFALTESQATGRAPFALAVAPLDGGAVPDVVVAERNDDTVSVLLGNGDGSFAERGIHPVGVFPEDVAVGDVNSDGFTDVVVCNRGSFDVSVLLGDGAGNLSTPRSFVAEEEPTALLLADLGGDEAGPGHLDVLAITANGNVSTLLNRGDGTLNAVENVVVEDVPSSVAVADLNDDALPDLIVASAGGVVSTLLALPHGGFLSSHMLPVGEDPAAVVAADLDRDEVIDIAVVDSQLDRLGVSFGAGGGHFGAFQFLSTPPQPVALAAGDFDQDGRIDLAVVAGDENGQVSVFLQAAERSFQEARSRSVGEEPIAIVAGKFDGDGFDDLAVANNGSSTLVVLQSNGNGTFRESQVLSGSDVPANPISLAAGDFDADGLSDLAVGGIGTLGSSVVVSFGNGDATFTPLLGLPLGQVALALVARDFSGDQVMDLAGVNQTNQLVVAVSRGNRRFSTRPGDRVSRLPIGVAAGDFDGDGRYDAVTANNAATSRNVSVLSNCARDPGCVSSNTLPGSAALRGDGSGDGRVSAADLVAVGVEVGDGDGRQVEGIALSGASGYAAAPGVDANGDGEVDARDRIATVRRMFAASENTGG